MKPGYKQTEVGVIPEEWESCDISDLCQLQRGFDITEATRKTGDIPVYSSSGLSYFHNEAKLQPPAVITGRKGMLGRVFFVEVPCWPHDTTLWVKDFKRNDPRYVSMFLGQFRLERFDAATSVPTLNRNNVVGVPIPLPPLPEQRAIAAALSDVDGLLGALDRLIAKKRDLKQAAMQQLLTGQTRLPGFKGEWVVKTFGEVFDYLPTATNSRSDLDDTGDTYYIHYGDIHTRFHNHLDFRTTQPPRIDRSICRNAALLKNGDWVMADASEDYDGVGKTVEIQGLEANINAISGLHTFVLRERTPTFAPGFKGHLGNMKSLHEQYLRVATGMKVYGVSKTALKDLELPVPPLPEQTAIASVLSEMDAELAGLEQRREKTRALKQGMMQELLTGRTRLVSKATPEVKA